MDVILRRTRSESITYRGRNRRQEIQDTLSTYDVIVEGEKVGEVERAMITRENRTAGRVYVNSRWESPGWVYATKVKYGFRTNYGIDYDTRIDALVQVLVHGLGVEYRDARLLAKTAKVEQ